MDNRTLAKQLLNYANSLEANGTNLYRLRSYRRAAAVVQMYPRPLKELLEEGGRKSLAALPGVGAHLAYTLEGLLLTGEFRTWAERSPQKASGYSRTA